MSRRFILNVDLDNVVGDYTAAFGAVVAETFNTTPEELGPQTDWKMACWGINTREDFEQLHRKAVVEHEIFRTMKPIDGAVDNLQRLSEDGVHIRIVTHRLCIPGEHYRITCDTAEWIDKHQIPYWDFCMVARKNHIAGHLLVDDAPHNIADAQKAGIPTITMDWPYNQTVPGHRANSWDDVYKHVHHLMSAAETLDRAMFGELSHEPLRFLSAPR